MSVHDEKEVQEEVDCLLDTVQEVVHEEGVVTCG